MQNSKCKIRSGILFPFCILNFAFALLTACNDRRALPARHARQAQPREWREDLPPRDRYVGSEACKECHEKNYARWTHDWHARALAKATPHAVTGDFGNAHFRGESSEAWFTRKGDESFVRTKDGRGE